MRTGEFSFKVTGGPPKVRKCLKWENRQIVSDEALALYKQISIVVPEMLAEDYETHEDFCAEYSETEWEELRILPISDWLARLEPYDAPVTSNFSRFFGDGELIPDTD